MFSCACAKVSPLPLVLPVETEREKELGQQLKQANDTAATLQDEFGQLQKEFEEFKQRNSKIIL